jgi:PAS domain S-box-containing protein
MTVRVALPDELERRVHLLYSVSRALADSDSVEEATSAVLEQIGLKLGWDMGAFWLIDPARNVIRSVAVWPPDAGPFQESTLGREFVRGEGLPGAVWESGRIEWVDDAQALRNFPRSEVARQEGVRAGIGIPICIGNSVAGMIEFFSRSLRKPDESTQRSLGGLGLQIGEFIERKRAAESELSSQKLVAATIDVALDCVVMIDAAGNILEFNPAAERTFGYVRSEILGKPMNELMVPPHLREQHRAGLARYLATGEARVLGRRIEIVAMRSDGSEFPVELAIQRVPVAGPPVFTAYLRDLTEPKRLTASNRLLLDASALLGASLDYEETLRNLSSVLVPAFADWYAADVVGADGSVRRIEVAHRDPAKVELARTLTERYPPDPADTRGVHEVIRTGKSQLMGDIPDEVLTKGAADEEHLALIRSLGLRSYMIVPMRARSGVVGALSLVTAESGRHYDETDLSIAENLASRAANAIENARLFSAVEEQRELLEQQATELEAQSSDLEETAAELEATVEDLRASNDELQLRTDEAEASRREADEANKTKSDFLASMSHELRTPLNAIIGYAQLLEIGVHGPIQPKQLEDVGRINRSAQHLLGLINDILNFAKVEAGRVEFDIEPVAMGSILGRVAELVTPQAKAKDLDYSVRDDCPGDRVCADPDKLMQVLVNLLSNAIRYTEPGGRIAVTCHAGGDKIVTEVSDTGAGIPPDKLDDIFEPFVQINQEYAGQHQGTGLGLAISRDLARGMGGELTVASEFGKGSVFTLTLRRDRKTASP